MYQHLLHLYRVSIGETERFQIQERYLNFFSFPSGHDQLYKTPSPPERRMKLFDDSTKLSDSSRYLATPCVILSGRKSLSIGGNRPVPLFPSPLSIPCSLNPSPMADGPLRLGVERILHSITDNFLNRWSRKTDLAICPFLSSGAILVQIEYSPSLTRVNHY